jgi:hypothetical protein
MATFATGFALVAVAGAFSVSALTRADEPGPAPAPPAATDTPSPQETPTPSPEQTGEIGPDYGNVEGVIDRWFVSVASGDTETMWSLMSDAAKSAWNDDFDRFDGAMRRDGVIGPDGYLSFWADIPDRSTTVSTITASDEGAMAVATITGHAEGAPYAQATSLPLRVLPEKTQVEAFLDQGEWGFERPELGAESLTTAPPDTDFSVTVQKKPEVSVAAVIGTDGSGLSLDILPEVTSLDGGLWRVSFDNPEPLPQGHYVVTYAIAYLEGRGAAISSQTLEFLVEE